ncbi:MAG: hypothetical protein DMF91_11025 [Acidobacteria bacterium]|nr:MAG: hypothetical protein DMF91_11025 [Acidobacteriota bacterium]
MRPGDVIIGGSMAGRLDVARLTSLTQQNVAPILQNATGSAYWYLVFKNYVVASGIQPKWVIVFFRDTNLTDPLFRLGGEYRGVLDRVALDREDELNAVVSARSQGGWFRAHALTADRWSRVHTLIDRMYGVERSRVWIEPAMTAWLARVAVGRQRRRAFLADVNTMFELERLRPLASADIGAPEDRDLDLRSNVTSSTLPLFLQLAKRHDLNLCFVRVLRRPQNGQPPDEPAALTRYVRDLREYIEARRPLSTTGRRAGWRRCQRGDDYLWDGAWRATSACSGSSSTSISSPRTFTRSWRCLASTSLDRRCLSCCRSVSRSTHSRS